MSTSTGTTRRPDSSVKGGGHGQDERHWWERQWRAHRPGPGPGERLRRWALFAAAAALALVALGTVAAVATYDGRDARNQARGPVTTSSSQDAVALWREGFDSADEVPHSVVYIHPLKSGAKPPPGLARWPAPGEAVLSPELLRAGKAERIAERYGRFAGTIGKAGLLSPSERLAYVRPRQAPDAGETESWWTVRGFGKAYPMGEALYQRPLSRTLFTLWLLTGVPALTLLTVAAGIGPRPAGRVSGPLRTPGAPWRHRAAMHIGEALRPAAAGTALAVVPLAVAVSTDVRIPPTGYLLNSADLRAAWPLAALALVLSFSATLAVTLAVAGARHRRGLSAARPRPRFLRVPKKWHSAGCGLGVAVVALSQYLSGTPGLLTFACGTVLMWALLPPVATVAVRKLGKSISARGSRTGRQGQLIGGIWTFTHPGGVARLAVAMIVGLGIVCQLLVWNGRPGETAAAARSTKAAVGDTVLSVRGRHITPSTVEKLARSLHAESHVFAIGTGTGTGRQSSLLRGSCQALHSLNLDCPTAPEAATSDDTRVTEIRHWYGPDLRVQVAPPKLRPGEADSSLLVITDSSGHRAQVEKAAYATVPDVNVETLGETWLVGAGTKARADNWLLLFGASGLALLLLAAALDTAAAFTRTRHTLASPDTLTGSRHQVLRSAALWHLTVPLLFATAVAAVVNVWHSLFFTAMARGASVPWDLLTFATCGFALLALVMGVLGGRTAARAARLPRKSPAP